MQSAQTIAGDAFTESECLRAIYPDAPPAFRVAPATCELCEPARSFTRLASLRRTLRYRVKRNHA